MVREGIHAVPGRHSGTSIRAKAVENEPVAFGIADDSYVIDDHDAARPVWSVA